MTEQKLRSMVAEKAYSYNGCREGSTEHRFLIDTYNKISPLPRNYKVTYKDAWCAAFVSAISRICGTLKIIPAECSCDKMIALHKNLGTWHENENYTPQQGDIIFYDWDDTGSPVDNKGSADHVGIVYSVNGKTITVVEGNKNDAVGIRTITVNAKTIRGYALPNYKSLATLSEADKAIERVQKANVIKGISTTDFGGSLNITREQLAVILCRFKDNFDKV